MEGNGDQIPDEEDTSSSASPDRFPDARHEGASSPPNQKDRGHACAEDLDAAARGTGLDTRPSDREAGASESGCTEVAGASGSGRGDACSPEAQLQELTKTLAILQQRAAASRDQAIAAEQRAGAIRGAQSHLQENIRLHGQSALEAMQQLEELAGKLSGSPQSPEMVAWLEELRGSLARLVALGEPRSRSSP